ncbi:MAG: DMP19 family protein [Terracidiphilus sp.]
MDKNAILIELSESDRTSFGRQDFSVQSVPQRVFSAIWAVEAEVNNGGFSQYFFNSSGETAGFVAEALDTVDAPRTADICRRAIAAAFPSGLPSDPEEISSAASDFSDETEEKLDKLDREFYQYPHDLTALLFAYVSRHPEEFGKMPDIDDA